MPIRIDMNMKVRGDEIELDFTGSDPQVNCAMKVTTGGQVKHHLYLDGPQWWIDNL